MNMKYTFQGLEPQNVLRNFWELSQIYSRRADNTQGISDYLANFGRKLGLRVEQDETTNVIIYKPATPGYEDAPTVMLAGHMDMICAANPGVVHDFDHEPLKLVLDEDRDTIHADGTTLGADDGLGIAFILSVLESDTIAHPAIEAVFTTNEETDMKGAWNLDYSKLSSKVILSLDATRLSLGGAGELEMEIFLERSLTPAREGDVQAVITIDGLIGGHSGKNAFAERGNAVTLLVRILADLQGQKQVPLRLISFVGGDYTACALARDASCSIAFPAEFHDTVFRTVEEWHSIFKMELSVPDPDVEVSVHDVDSISPLTCDDATTEKFINLLTLLPDGLCSLHKYFEHKYESCVNEGVVKTSSDSFRIVSCIRSAMATKKYFQLDKIQRLCALFGARYNILHDLPQWEYNSHARIAEVIGDIYSDLEPNVAQGTCEQGIFLMKMPGAEAAGVGPFVDSPHSPSEKISVAAVADDWARFVKVLAAMKQYNAPNL